MKGLILLANHFEDVEAICTIDMIRRVNIELDLVSVIDNLDITTQSGLKVKAEKVYNEINLDDYEFVILPGGKAVYETHLESEVTNSIIKDFYNKHKLICAICAAPMVLKDYLKDKDFTCFPSCEETIKGHYTKNKVEVVDNIITSKAAGTTFEFSYEIIKYLKGEELAKKVLKSVYYL